MKNLLSDQEKLDLFQVEELELRLEMWEGGDPISNPMCPNPPNWACADAGCGIDPLPSI